MRIRLPAIFIILLIPLISACAMTARYEKRSANEMRSGSDFAAISEDPSAEPNSEQYETLVTQPGEVGGEAIGSIPDQATETVGEPSLEEDSEESENPSMQSDDGNASRISAGEDFSINPETDVMLQGHESGVADSESLLFNMSGVPQPVVSMPLNLQLLPEDWPESVPIPNGFTVQMGTQEQTEMLVVASGSVNPEAVNDLYRALEGWEVRSSVQEFGFQPGDSAITGSSNLEITRDNEVVFITIIDGPDKTTLILEYTISMENLDQ